jgi:hypothetical protein
MAEGQENGDLRARAEKRVKEREKLKWHAATYLIINLFLWGIWLVIALTNSPHDWQGVWPIWVTLGWGIGLAFNFFGYYTGRSSEARREELIEREMEKMRGED